MSVPGAIAVVVLAALVGAGRRLGFSQVQVLAEGVSPRRPEATGVPWVRVAAAAAWDRLGRLWGRAPAAAGPSTDDLQRHLRRAADAGAVSPAAHALARRLIRLDEQPIARLMTRRSDVVWIDMNDPAETIIARLAACPMARLPVCDGSLDRIIGVVDVRDLWLRSLAGAGPDLRGLLKLPLFLYQGTPALRALELLRGSAVPQAVVIDEFGGVKGLLDAGDVLAAVVGDLGTADRAEAPAIERRDDGSWHMPGTVAIDEVVEALGLPARPPGDGHTLAGFVIERLGRIPAPQDAVEWDGLRIEVLSMAGNRVKTLRVVPGPPPTPTRRRRWPSR